MNRKDIIEKLLSEGFTERTLSRMTDKELLTLSKTMLSEETVMVSKKNPNAAQDIANAKKQNKTIETYESKGDVCPICGMKDCTCKDKKHKNVNEKEEKPSAGLSKKKKGEIVKKAKKGEDIGKKGKSFKDIESKAKKSGADNPKAVAAAAMWKNIKRESVKDVSEIEEWVLNLAESKYTNFTSKKDIMTIINEKVSEAAIAMPTTKARKGHNGIPEFMTYDSIVANQPAPSKPDVDTPVKPKTPTKPNTNPTIDPFQPGPGVNPKPKALAEKKKK